MPKITDSYIKNLRATDREQMVLIDTCLYLRITKSWHGKATKKWLLYFNNAEGKKQKFVFGEYPAMGLADARHKAAELLARAKAGENLAQTKKEGRDNTEPKYTFKKVAEQWLESQKSGWVEGHAERQIQRLENTAIRIFGDKDINEVTVADVDAAVGLLSQKGSLESASRAMGLIKRVFKYAASLDMLENGLILNKLDAYQTNIPRPKTENHFYRELSEAEIGELLSNVESYVVKCRIETSVALRVMPYVLCRPGELCGAMWKEIDFENAEWRIPAERMKMSRDHIIPLPAQALALFTELRQFTQNGEYCFQSWAKDSKASCLNTNTLTMAFRRMGYASTRKKEGILFTPHSFRGMGARILYQTLNYPGHLIELQLAT